MSQLVGRLFRLKSNGKCSPGQKNAHTSACMCSCMCSKTCMSTCMCSKTCMRTCLCSQTCMCACMCAHMCSQTCMCAHMCAFMCSQTLSCSTTPLNQTPRTTSFLAWDKLSNNYGLTCLWPVVFFYRIRPALDGRASCQHI